MYWNKGNPVVAEKQTINDINACLGNKKGKAALITRLFLLGACVCYIMKVCAEIATTAANAARAITFDITGIYLSIQIFTAQTSLIFWFYLLDVLNSSNVANHWGKF